MTNRRLVVGASLLLVVTGCGWLFEAGRALWGRDFDQRAYPHSWLPGVQRVVELEHFLEQAVPLLPSDALVAVDSKHLDERNTEILRRWCAYLLPRQRLVLAKARGALRPRPAYVLTYPALGETPAGTAEVVSSGVASLHRYEASP